MLFSVSSIMVKAEERNEGIWIDPVDFPEITARIENAYLGPVDRDFVLNSFAMEHAKKFTPSDLARIKSMIPELSDQQLQMIMSGNYKDPTTMLIISVLLGGLGVDRFMLGETGLGVLKLVTGGGLGIWWLVDLFSIENRTKTYNMKQFEEAVKNSQLLLTDPTR